MLNLLRRRKLIERQPPIIYRFDLDKTYLKTAFESLRGLARIPFEKAIHKRTVPGVVPLARGLRESARAMSRDSRLFFLSASPPQIGVAIKGKLQLDGIEYDDIIFKDQLRNIMRGKFRNLREQIGFKLVELLKSRVDSDGDAQEVMFGDDWESDPLIYSLYADTLSGRLDAAALQSILTSLAIDADLSDEALRLAGQLAPREVVRRIFINLERRTPPAQFEAFGGRLVPTFDYLQTATALLEMGLVNDAVVAEVAADLSTTARYSPRALLNSLDDLARRGHIKETTALRARRILAQRELVSLPEPKRVAHWAESIRRWRRERATPPMEPATIEYPRILARWASARRVADEGQKEPKQ